MAPNPTPILRFTHIDNLATIIRRGGLHAPNYVPDDGLTYRFCHDADVQNSRANVSISVGRGGTIHDYVPFYFGCLSPMMLKLKTGQVAGYNEGQEPLIHLVSTAQNIQSAGLDFVFSDGHGLARFTDWFNDLARLDAVDWAMVNQRYWADKLEDMDRQRRKQAEFLIFEFCPWELIQNIVVVNSTMKQRIESIQTAFPAAQRRVVMVNGGWYY